MSEASFARDYFEPKGMSFSQSDALFPPQSIRASLAADYNAQCAVLCFGPFPTFEEVGKALQDIRSLL